MMVSTKGRYALRVMIDLAKQPEGEYTAMKEVAARQDISLKYLEKILPVLVAEKMVEGTHGKGGGYRLTRAPKEYRAGEILRATEGDLAPVACLECNAKECDKKEVCPTLPMWSALNDRITSYLDSVTLEDLLTGQVPL